MQNTKYRKLRTIQMNYPAPYSQTWADPQAVPTGVDKMKKSASFQANRNKSNDPTCNRCWQRPKPLTHGSNPYAPHLKYGLFPRKINLREPLHKLHKLPMGKKKSPTDEIHILMDKCKDRDDPYESMKERHHSDHRNVNLNDSNAPLFVIRPIDKRYTRQLSLSEVTHVDIKPQRSAPLPLITSPRSPLGERMRRKNRGNTKY